MIQHLYGVVFFPTSGVEVMGFDRKLYFILSRPMKLLTKFSNRS